MTTKFHKMAEEQNILLRTLDQVRADLVDAKTRDADEAMARLMLRHGRLTDEAILYIGDNYPSVWED